MFSKSSPKTLWLIAFAAAALSTTICAYSATVFETTELAAATQAADAALPGPITFEIATAGSYTVTLTDLQVPGPLASLKAIVAHDLQTVAQLEVTYPTAPAVPAPATQAFMATPGTYRVHVLGIPKAGEAVGGFGISVAPTAGGASVADHADVVAAPSGPGSGQSLLQTTFNIDQAGTYQLILTDHEFPAALTSMLATLLQETDSGVAEVLTSPDPITTPGTYQFDATLGTYQLFVVATAPTTTLAGLYSVRIAAGSASPVYRSVQPVGLMPPAADVAVTTAGQYSLTLADVNFPASLSSMGAAVMQGDALLGKLTTAGASSATAAQGTVQLYALATPAAAAEVGAFSLQLAQGSLSLYEDVRIADVSADPTTPAIFAIQARNPIAAGAYRLTVEDFALPLAFSSLRSAVVQGAAVLGTLNSAGNAVFTVQSGSLKVLVAATPPAASGNALFGMTFVSTPDGTVAMEATQGVGGLFPDIPSVDFHDRRIRSDTGRSEIPIDTEDGGAGDYSRHHTDRSDFWRRDCTETATLRRHLRTELSGRAGHGGNLRCLRTQSCRLATAADSDVVRESCVDHLRSADDAAVVLDGRNDLHGIRCVDRFEDGQWITVGGSSECECHV